MIIEKLHRISKILGVLCILIAAKAQAIRGQDLTELEWAAWPDYCKLGFLASEWGKDSSFIGRVPRSLVVEFNTTSKERVGISGLHHFCVGLTYINRARGGIGITQEKSAELMNNAVSEIAYSYGRTEKRAPLYSVVTAYYGVALYRSGQHEKAFKIWKDGITTQPTRPESYVAMAEALRSEKKMKEALEILLQFDKRKEQPSAEAEYFLGHTYLDLGLYNEAKKHADNAYRLGYPLPGLRNKLRRVGK